MNRDQLTAAVDRLEREILRSGGSVRLGAGRSTPESLPSMAGLNFSTSSSPIWTPPGAMAEARREK